MKLPFLAGLAAALGGAGAAHAGDLEELRLGAVEHNIQSGAGQDAPKEDGPNIEGELVWESPGFLKIIGSPRPYVMASVNTRGNTSFGGVGLYWRYQLASDWALEGGLGYVLHNGKIDVPYPQGDPRNQAYKDRYVLLGSRDLFRDTIAIEREVGSRMAVQAYYEHLSHGQILGQGRNQGLDEIGLRFILRLHPKSDAAE